jgi:hypothetical protein
MKTCKPKMINSTSGLDGYDDHFVTIRHQIGAATFPGCGKNAVLLLALRMDAVTDGARD